MEALGFVGMVQGNRYSHLDSSSQGHLLFTSKPKKPLVIQCSSALIGLYNVFIFFYRRFTFKFSTKT